MRVRRERGGISWLEGWGIVVLLLNILWLRNLLLILIAILTTLVVIRRGDVLPWVSALVVLVRIPLSIVLATLVVVLEVGLFRRSKLLRCRVVCITVLIIDV